MKFLVNLLLVPALLGVSNISKNDNNKKKTNDVAQVISNNVSEGNKITVDLNPEPYYKKDNFVTSFQYTGELRVVDYWFKCENIKTNWNDKYLFERGKIDVEVICYEKVGSFTLYMMNEEKDVSEISVFTRLTEYGVFATTGSQKVCDNKVLEYEYHIGVLKDEQITRIFNSDIVLEGAGSPISYLPNANDGETGFEGQFTWEDMFGKSHPCSGLNYSAYSIDYDGYSDVLACGYLDENGCYSFSIPSSKAKAESIKMILSCQTRLTSVGPFDDHKVDYTFTFDLDTTIGYINRNSYCFPHGSDDSKPVQIISGLYWAQKFRDTHYDKFPIGVKVYYPGDGCYETLHKITLTEDAYEMPDVFLHEYGHVIEHYLGLFDVWHALDYTSPDGHTFWEDYTLSRDKGAALRRNFTESLATVFAFIIEREYPQYFGSIFKASDSYYDNFSWIRKESDRYNPDYRRDDTDFENLSKFFTGGADAYELSTGAFLLDLYDNGNNETWDKIALGSGEFWRTLNTYKPKTADDLIKALYDNEIVNLEDLGSLLEQHGFTASNVRSIYSSNSNRTTIAWNRSGTPNMVDGHISNTVGNEFILKFYDANGEFMFERTSYGTSYTLSNYEWQSILNRPGVTYKVKIGAKSTRGGFTTGFNYGRTHELVKIKNDMRGFDISSVSELTSNNSVSGIVNCDSNSFVSTFSWKNVSKVTNNKNQEFLCLNPGLASDHKSFVKFRTSSIFKSVSFDLVFSTNHADLSNTTIEIHKFSGDWVFDAYELDPHGIGMDKDTDKRYSFAIPLSDADGFEIVVTGYGYTSLCLRNINFELNHQ